jgi:DNA-binding Xre family transcriptional regulator
MAWLAGRPGRRVPAALAGTRGYAVESIGDVICGLDELLLVAAERWRTRLTQQDLARISGLSRSTINELLPRRVWAHALGGAATETEIIPYQGRVALHTIAALCSVFICLPGELLRYRAPGQSLSRLSPNAVRRDEIPPRRVNVYPLTNTIPERLQAYTPAGLEKAAGISWSRWNRVKAGTTQIDLPMLAAICAVLNTDVSGILAHSIPFRDSTWSVRFVRFDDLRLTFDLTNGVTVSAYLARWKPLLQAPIEERARWHLTPDRQGVRWDALDVEIYPRLLLS